MKSRKQNRYSKQNSLLKMQEVADYLSVSRHTLEIWVSDSKIPCYRFSPKIVRFDIEKINEWMRLKEQHPAFKV